LSVPPCFVLRPQGRPYRATISDSEGASLPGRGVLVEDDGERRAVVQLAEELGRAAAGSGARGGGALPSAAPSTASLGAELWRDNPSFLHRGDSSSAGLD
jgi:hypothetical protein